MIYFRSILAYGQPVCLSLCLLVLQTLWFAEDPCRNFGAFDVTFRVTWRMNNISGALTFGWAWSKSRARPWRGKKLKLIANIHLVARQLV